MNISVVMIGKNSEKTLHMCINSIKQAINNCSKVKNYEIIYVDSMSKDNSVKIAKDNVNHVISITEGYISASLGRYLGLKYSQYDDLLFVDSDMEIDINWFNGSYEYYQKYNALIGERYEVLYKKEKVVDIIPRFYRIDCISSTDRIGGFLMISKKIISSINYSPILLNEEEKDFYSKFYVKNKIFQVPILAYKHHNRNLAMSRILDYLSFNKKNGYIVSFINAILKGYLGGYVRLQHRYIISMITSLLFYYLLCTNPKLSPLPVFFLGVINLKAFKGSFFTMIFFPYKLISALYIFCKEKVYKYKIDDEVERIGKI